MLAGPVGDGEHRAQGGARFLICAQHEQAFGGFHGWQGIIRIQHHGCGKQARREVMALLHLLRQAIGEQVARLQRAVQGKQTEHLVGFVRFALVEKVATQAVNEIELIIAETGAAGQGGQALAQDIPHGGKAAQQSGMSWIYLRANAQWGFRP